MAHPSRSAVSVLAAVSRRAARWLAYLVALCAVVLATIVLGFAVQARGSYPDLHPWHRVVLAREYRAGEADSPTSFDAYRALEDGSLPQPERLYLVSPAIGITPFAALTNVAAGLSFLPAFEKSKWIDVRPEYDPYKYNSFPVNAAKQIYNLTRVLHRELLAAEKDGLLDRMPKVCVFQSVVDSTITAQEVVRGLLAHLPANGHELVAFDVNRREALEGLLAPGPLEDLERLRNEPSLPFRLTIVGNRPDGTARVATYTREAGEREITEHDLPLEWPRGVFSVGHVSLPFPPDDPVYGLEPAGGGTLRFNLGAVPARGEDGALLVPLGMFARLRSNPFFDVIRAKVVESLAAER